MDIITLDVGGKKFKCSKHLLISRCKYFEDLFSEYDDKKEIYIDRSPHIFKHILALIRDHRYQYPKKYNEELYYFLMKKKNTLRKSKQKFEELTFYEKINFLEKDNLYTEEIECYNRLKTFKIDTSIVYNHDSINCNCDNCKLYRLKYFINTGRYYRKTNVFEY